jgi:hypothetical protein
MQDPKQARAGVDPPTLYSGAEGGSNRDFNHSTTHLAGACEPFRAFTLIHVVPLRCDALSEPHRGNFRLLTGFDRFVVRAIDRYDQQRNVN